MWSIAVLTLFACGGIIGELNGGPCSVWSSNAPDTLTVAQGGNNQITFAPAVNGITITGAELAGNSMALGISITQMVGNTFIISADSNTPTGTYVIPVRAVVTVGNTDYCHESAYEDITITIQ